MLNKYPLRLGLFINVIEALYLYYSIDICSQRYCFRFWRYHKSICRCLGKVWLH